MKRILLTVILAIIGIGAGGAGGAFLKAPDDETNMSKEVGDASGEEDAHSREAKQEEDKKSSAEGEYGAVEHSKTKSKPEDAERDFVKIERQFVVPVLEDERVSSLVVLSLAVEVDAGESDIVFEHEPKLRDAFLSVLFTHAQSRGFDGDFTQERRLEDLRGSLTNAAQEVLGKRAHGILLTGIVRQDI